MRLRADRSGLGGLWRAALGMAAVGLMIAVLAVPRGVAETETFSAPVAVIHPACRGGYQRQGTFYDYALGRAWTIFARCGHPEMPRLAIAPELPQGEATTPAAPPLSSKTDQISPPAPSLLRVAAAPAAVRPVVAGSRVRLWKQDSRAQIELTGVALESGALGAPVRVRIRATGQVLRGVVRGPGSVELAEPPGFSGGFSGAGQ